MKDGDTSYTLISWDFSPKESCNFTLCPAYMVTVFGDLADARLATPNTREIAACGGPAAFAPLMNFD